MQFRDLKRQYETLKDDIDRSIKQVMEEGQFILGRHVGELEEQLANYVGVRHCISCANGTDALQLVLMAWGIGKGDAVFTSDFTFFASAGAISIVGATPILVDIDINTYNIDPDCLESEIQAVMKEGKLVPKAIIPVDLFGLPCNYPRICEIANRYGLRVLEDGAQGFGGAISERRACSFGDASATSFFPAKPLGCYGDGGAIFTNDDIIDEKLRSLRAQGRSPEDKYDNRVIGMNSRLDTMQAAVLLPKFKAFAEHEIADVNRVAAWYNEQLREKVKIPYIPQNYLSGWAQYTIQLKSERQRNDLQCYLKEKGIPSMVYYPRAIHQQSVYENMQMHDSHYPNASNAASTVLSLPMHPYLTCDEVMQISQAVTGFIGD